MKKIGSAPGYGWIQDALFLVVCLYYLLQKIHPVFIIESQAPSCILHANYFSQSIGIPGGLTDWLAAFLMQFWSSDGPAALSLIICLWLAGYGTRKWIETYTPVRPVHTVHLIPAGLLLILHSQYEFHLSITLALLINLFALLLFLRWAPAPLWPRMGSSLIAIATLYWITGGAYFLFVALSALDDMLAKKRISVGIVTLFISAALPFLAQSTMILTTLRQAFLHNLSFESLSEVSPVEYCLPVYFLAIFAVLSLSRSLGRWRPVTKLAAIPPAWKWLCGTALLLSCTALLSDRSVNEIKQHVFTINRAIDEERWTDVLALTRTCTNETPLLLSGSNLALYETGKLLDSMFAYPQSKGTLGLLMNQTWSLAWPEQASNISWKLGLINDALHWSHEALERKGPTARLLRTLGINYMLKGNYAVARRYFLNLRDVPGQQATATALLRLNAHPADIPQNSEYALMLTSMPLEDMISRERNPVPKLELLLRRNPNNKMAFQYLIAYYLLNGNLKEILDHLPDFMAFDSTHYPRHVQEALIFISASTPHLPVETLKKLVSPQNFKRFLEYRQAFMNNTDNMQHARQTLHAQFGDTYWYYLMFVKPASRPLESQNEFQ